MPDSTTTNTSSPIGGWHELQIPSRKQCPKLFYLFSTQQDSFSLLLTDLISIWDQSLDKDGILQEAAREHTSIDPSVSSEQFKVFLSKLCKSLQDGDNVVAKDDLKGRDRDARQSLLLKTKTALPKPLKPLVWTFKLKPQNASEMAERILRPSLHEVAVSQEKINSLLRIVSDKDRVISRLLDRIGNSAVDLGLIFPGITGMASRKGGHVSVVDAKRYVPGMAGFDEKAWTGLFSNDDGYEGADRTGLSNLVRGCEKCFAHTKEEHEDWIKDLSNSVQMDLNGDESVTSSPKATRREKAQRQKDREDVSTGSDEDNDFERLPTPPGIKAKNARAGKTFSNIASSEEDDDVKKRPSKPTSSKKIGSIGRRNATKASEPSKRTVKSSSPPGADPATPPPRHRRPSNISTSTATATASEEDDDAEAKSKPKHQPPLKQRGPRSATPKLGGSKKKPEARPSPSRSPSSPSPMPAKTPPRRSKPRKTAPTESHRRSQRLATESPSRDDEIPKSASDDEIDLDLDRGSRPASSTRRHRLGRVGGRKSLTTTPDKPSTRSSPARTTAQTASQATPTKKLGRLGARRQRQAESPPAGAEDPSSSTRVETNNKKRTRNSDRGRDRDRDRKRRHDGGGEGASEDEDAASTDSTASSASRSGTKQKKSLASHPRAKSSPGQTIETSRSETKIVPAGKANEGKEKEEEEEEEEETAEQKANRRRAELKRSIEAAAGAKKKRRF